MRNGMELVAECCTRIRMASPMGVESADGVVEGFSDGVAEACAEGVRLSADFNNGVDFVGGVAKTFADGVEAVLLEGVPTDFTDFARDDFALFALLAGEGDGSYCRIWTSKFPLFFCGGDSVKSIEILLFGNGFAVASLCATGAVSLVNGLSDTVTVILNRSSDPGVTKEVICGRRMPGRFTSGFIGVCFLAYPTS